MSDVLDRFGTATRAWFASAFAEPTAAQAGAWAAVSAGRHALVVAPTGSGKTLAAFLWALDRLATQPRPEVGARCRVLYVSPLKALAVDVERNLRVPLTGIRHAADRLGVPPPDITVGMRTGDTPADERRAFVRTPPDILITTPESLFLILTSAARDSLRSIETVIVDEVHAVTATKRGAHLALSLERLDALLPRPAQRIGLSATVRPIEEVARFLGGAAPVEVVAPPTAKTIEVTVEVPVEDMTRLDEVEEDPDDPQPRRASIWPAVEQRVYDLITSHRSTIVFANSRRLSERLCARLNEIATERAGMQTAAPLNLAPAQVMAQSVIATGAPTLIARAHHGSVSREERKHIEEALKSGRLPAVVATSSLELGIDMGAVDLVVQIEAPPSVAAGLQRVGRAGHQVGAVSRGVVFPKHRGDLLSCAVVAERMHAGLIEEMRYPRNPLDVLAQQIVAMVAMDAWDVADLATLVRRSAPFAELPGSALDATLDMLSGRYPSTAFAELRPRIVWDREGDRLTPQRGAQHLAVTSGGTIPDRGLFGVFLAGAERAARVGELDEEMVYESRIGDVFLLGSTSWRIEDITPDRVLVSPAPGAAARMPFWKGDQPGRPVELGKAIGAKLRGVVKDGRDAAAAGLSASGLDPWAVDNLLSYVDDQRAATGHLPDDRTVVVERFRDELGDWRLAVHCVLGAKVNGAWALAIGRRLTERYGVDAQVLPSDDGIVVRLPDVVDANGLDAPPSADLIVFEADEISLLVEESIGGSAMFAARFRECAARSLLLPRRDPRRRQPLWQQRQRAAQLLDVARDYGDFPVTLEAARECLQDVLDVPGLAAMMRDITARRVRVVEVETTKPSPFARSLLFGYVGAFLYGDDVPLAERRAAALALDSTLLGELLGRVELRELLDADVVLETERRLQWLDGSRTLRDAEDAVELLRVLGDLSTEECVPRGARTEWLTDLAAAKRIVAVRIASQERWIVIEDAGRVRDALGVALPVGLAGAYLEPVADPIGDLVARYARTRGPFTAAACAARFGLGVFVVEQALKRLAATGRLAAGEFTPLTLLGAVAGTEWCDAEVLRLLRRRSLAALRREIEPVPPATLAAFLPRWQQVGTSARGVEAVAAALEQLQGTAIPASAWERLVLPARVADYTPAYLDELCSAGEIVWSGAGSIPGGDGWVVFAWADSAPLTLPPADPDFSGGPLHTAILGALDRGLFFRQLTEALGEQPGGALGEQPGGAHGDANEAEVLAALWDLVWAGLVSNDTLAPVRALLAGGGAHKSRPTAPRGRYRTPTRLPPSRLSRTSLAVARGGPPSAVGRWYRLPERDTNLTRRATTVAELLLERHGIVTRGAVMAEGTPGGFAAVYPVLAALEERGAARRGYFVEGLGAAQFAITGAVDRLRALSDAAASVLPSSAREPVPAGAVLGGAGPDWAAARGGAGAGGTRSPGAGTGRAASSGAGARGGAGAGGAGAGGAGSSGAGGRGGAGAGGTGSPGAGGRGGAGAGGAGPGGVAGRSSGGPARALVLAATDPANPYGAALPWPERASSLEEDGARSTGHRAGRKAGALVVTVSGELGIYVERGGRTLLSYLDDSAALSAAANALAAAVRSGALGPLSVEKADGETVHSTALGAALAEAGFRATPRGLRLRA